MDDHTYDKDNEHIAVCSDNIGYDIRLPGAAYAVHHRLGRVPGHLVGLGGVEVGAAAEEKTREGDEHKGKEYVPHLFNFEF